MAIPVLIVTPENSFGALLRKGMDVSRYEVFSTSDFSEAIHFVRNRNCPITILDADLEDIDVAIADISYALYQIKSDLQFILVQRSGQGVNMSPLSPAAIYSKPVPFPELQNSIDSILQSANPQPLPAKTASPSAFSDDRLLAQTSRLMWLKDVSKAAQHLTRLTLESSAQAALITRENELWAYAGQLSREAAMELARSIEKYWDRDGGSDMLRFIRLQSTEAQHMLYARKLSANMILALVFDGETPFSTIRAQAGNLVKNLAESSFNSDLGPAPSATKINAGEPAPLPLPKNYAPEEEHDEEEKLPPFAQLLGDVPPPIPPRPTPTLPRVEMPAAIPEPRLAVDEPATQPPHTLAANLPPEAINHFSRESSPAIRRDAIKRPIPAVDETLATGLTGPQTELDLAQRSANLPDHLQVTRKHEVQKDPETLVETRPQTIAESMTQVAHRILLEPASPAMANLAYACLLIPRFDSHHLIGDAAERLTEWIPQLCVAFGWRLEHMSVRPEYLQWVVRVPPSTTPSYIMRIIRQQTSERLFNEFPKFKKENPSGDFWAPGYMIMGTPDPHPQKLVRDFIKQTRQRQGVAPSGE